MARHPTRKHGVKRGSSAGVAMSCHRVYYGPSVMVPVPVDLWSSAGVEGDQAGGRERIAIGCFMALRYRGAQLNVPLEFHHANSSSWV